MRRFTQSHEWIELDGDAARVGITPHAVEQLGDLVFFEATAAGRTLSAGDAAATLESVKAAAEVYAPVGGEVLEGNPAVVEDPSRINADPLANWLFTFRPSDPASLDSLMDEDAYNQMLLAA